jgi:hypothetical protein
MISCPLRSRRNTGDSQIVLHTANGLRPPERKKATVDRQGEGTELLSLLNIEAKIEAGNIGTGLTTGNTGKTESVKLSVFSVVAFVYLVLRVSI